MTPETNSRTIVVGYDGSRSALAAVEHAIDRVGPDGRLVVVHAYLTPTDHIGASYYTEMVEDASQYATDLLDGLEQDCERLATIEYERDLGRRVRRHRDRPSRRDTRGRRDRHRQPRRRSHARAAGERRPRRHPPRALSRHRDPRAHGGPARGNAGRGSKRRLSALSPG